MGLLDLIGKSISTAARNSTISTVGSAASGIISAAQASDKKGAKEKDSIIVKNGKTFVFPTRNSENYHDEHVLSIAKELHGAGFENIEIKPCKKLKEGAYKKYGKVRSISISGNDDFRENKKFLSSSYVLIEYLDFKDDVSPNVYFDVKRIDANAVNSAYSEQLLPVEEPAEDISSFTIKEISYGSKRYCSFCGSKIENENANFCVSCGKRI